MFLPVLITVASLLMIYIYSVIKRFILTAGLTYQRKTKICAIVLSVIAAVLCLIVIDRAAIVFLHIILIDLLVRLVNVIIKKITKDTYDTHRVWKKIYGFTVIPLVATTVILVLGYLNMMNVVETDYHITTEKNIRQEGYRVALIADVHFGISLDYEQLQKLCDNISEKSIDMVFICGDIVDENTTKNQMQQVFKALGTIKNTMGCYYVYGNHDRQMYKDNSAYTEEDLKEAIETGGIKILTDQVVQVNSDIVIAGREDNYYSVQTKGVNRTPIGELLKEADKNSFIITLDHRPLDYEENAGAGTDLILSGHTHGGQIWPANILFKIIKFDDAVYGQTDIKSMKAIVTSGLAGWGFPVKTAAPSEYVIIDIKRKY